MMKKPKGVAVMRIIIKPKKGGSDDSPVDDDADDDYDGVQEDDDGHGHGMGMAMKLIQSLMGGGDKVDKAEEDGSTCAYCERRMNYVSEFPYPMCSLCAAAGKQTPILDPVEGVE